MYAFMKNVTSIILLLMSVVSLATDRDINVLPVVGTATAGTALARADVALARSVVNPTAFRGSLGENVVGNTFLKNSLSQTGNWQSVTPRSGPQGLDHLFIKTNAEGMPKQLIVGESKFNTSRLGITKDGIQMGGQWIDKRLIALGSRYLAVANDSSISFSKLPLHPNRQISVILKNGQQVHFWKNSSLDQWKFSGTQRQLEEAKRLAANYGVFLKNAGNGIVTYRSRIFNIIPKGNDLEIVMYDAKNLDSLQSIKKLKQVSSIKLPNVLSKNGSLPIGTQDDVARALKAKLGLSDSDSRKLARDVAKRYNSKDLMSASSLPKSLLLKSGMASFAAIGLDAAIQLATSGNVEVGRLAVSGSSVFLGVGAGQVIHVSLMNPSAYNLIKSISGPINCSTSMLTTSISSFGGGVITSALFSYGLYFMGYSDLQTANRQMIIGTTATGAGILFTTTTMAAIATWGTASTGTAIAGLGGAAATNASLAWLGGGSLAAGGGGVAAGTAVLTGGAIIVVAAVAYGGYKLYQLKDESDENKRIRTMIDRYSQPSYMSRIIENSPFVRTYKR